MEWFNLWWNDLSLLGKVFACSAVPMTVVMVLQLILLIIGVGFGGDSDADSDTDADAGADIDTDGDTDTTFAENVDIGLEAENDAALGEISSYVDKSFKEVDSKNNTSILKIFTIRGIVAFFAIGGWAGLASLSAGINAFWAFQIALFAGVSALLLASIVIRLALRMQTSGNINISYAVAQTAEVYIRIPPARSEKGKVTMLLQERFVELDAVTDCDVELMPQTKVEVIALAERDCLVVRPIADD